MTENVMVPNVPVKAFGKGGILVFEGMLSDFPAAIIAQAAAYAIHKKAQDASGGKDIETESQSREAAQAVIANLKAGTWASRAVGSRIKTFEQWLAKQAADRAKELTKPKAPHAGKDPTKVAEALLAKEDWVAKQRQTWENMQLGEDELELDI